jgi:hypothetical protein
MNVGKDKVNFKLIMNKEFNKVPYTDECNCECHKPGTFFMIHVMACCKPRPKEINE